MKFVLTLKITDHNYCQICNALLAISRSLNPPFNPKAGDKSPEYTLDGGGSASWEVVAE
jgi:hypothetical protein